MRVGLQMIERDIDRWRWRTTASFKRHPPSTTTALLLCYNPSAGWIESRMFHRFLCATGPLSQHSNHKNHAGTIQTTLVDDRIRVCFSCRDNNPRGTCCAVLSTVLPLEGSANEAIPTATPSTPSSLKTPQHTQTQQLPSTASRGHRTHTLLVYNLSSKQRTFRGPEVRLKPQRPQRRAGAAQVTGLPRSGIASSFPGRNAVSVSPPTLSASRALC